MHMTPRFSVMQRVKADGKIGRVKSIHRLDNTFHYFVTFDKRAGWYAYRESELQSCGTT